VAVLKAAWRKQTLELSPDGEFLVSASADGMVRLWDSRFGEEEMKVAFSLDGTRLAFADYGVTLFNGKSGAEIARLTDYEGYSKVVAFSPDSTRLAFTADDGTIRLWDSESGIGVASLLLPSRRTAYG
jgi:WD40 repeat protein